MTPSSVAHGLYYTCVSIRRLKWRITEISLSSIQPELKKNPRPCKCSVNLIVKLVHDNPRKLKS